MDNKFLVVRELNGEKDFFNGFFNLTPSGSVKEASFTNDETEATIFTDENELTECINKLKEEFDDGESEYLKYTYTERKSVIDRIVSIFKD